MFVGFFIELPNPPKFFTRGTSPDPRNMLASADTITSVSNEEPTTMDLKDRSEPASDKSHSPFPLMFSPKEAARHLKVSTSWLAKARMRGDGPPFTKIGRSIRYSQLALLQWMKSRQRLSTSEM